MRIRADSWLNVKLTVSIVGLLELSFISRVLLKERLSEGDRMHPSRPDHTCARGEQRMSPAPIVHPDHNSYPPFTCQLNLYDRRLVLLKLPNAECVSTLNMPHATLRLKYTANIMTPTHQIRSGAYSGSSVRDFLCLQQCSGTWLIDWGHIPAV